MQRRAKKKKVVPREHGFWVMLTASSFAGLLLSPTRLSFFVAVALILLSILGALVFARVVRRNMALQLVSAVLLAILLVPIAAVGQASWEETLRVSLPLLVSYLASALCVQEVILRAKKLPQQGEKSGRAAIFFACLGALLAFVFASWRETTALALAAVFVTSIHFLAPSPKRLKRVGLSIAVVQALSVLLLAL